MGAVEQPTMALGVSLARGRVTLKAAISPLELLHPAGLARRSAVLGAGCPRRLHPSTTDAAENPCDLVVLAPTLRECRRPRWLEHSIASIGGRLAADGVVYALIPPGWRGYVRKLFIRNGLPVELEFLHLPDLNASRYLVPLDARAVEYAVSRTIPVHPVKQRLLRLAVRVSRSRALLSMWLPSIGLVAHRRGARPLMAWLFEIDGQATQPRQVMIGSSWRGQTGSVVMHRLSQDFRASAIAKINWNLETPDEPVDEAEQLLRIAARAQVGYTRIPTGQRWVQVAGAAVLTQPALQGQTVISLLAARPACAGQVMALVADWLTLWNGSTRVLAMSDETELRDAILRPGAALASRIAGGQEYCDWLRSRCAGIGSSMPRVAAHRDLTAWNLLIDQSARLGVVDWADAHEADLPLGDFFYSMTDIAMWAMRTGRDRVKAFQMCFAPWGRYRPVVLPHLRSLANALELELDMLEVCLHATFLHHAGNEQRQRRGDLRQESFLQLVDWLATNRTSVRRWLQCS